MAFGDLWLFLFPGFALFLAWLTSPSVSGLSLASSFRQNIQKKVFPPFFFSFCAIFLCNFFPFQISANTPKYILVFAFVYALVKK